MISVLILTKNEEKDLPGCIASVSWSNDVQVFDSHSTDATVQIASSLGAKVTQRKFDGYASQRNAALHNLAFRNDWVLVLDADERIPQGLASEMLDFVQHSPIGVSACRIRRRDFIGDVWLKHAQLSAFYLRLLRPERVYYEREVNEVLRVRGIVADLTQYFDHFPFSKGMYHWLEKHNRYSTMEAEEVMKIREGNPSLSLSKLFSTDFNDRRFHQKELFYMLPARPLLKWLYMVIVRGSFLDGKPGLTYATLQAFYEYLIVLKTRELKAGRTATVI